eukprot:scaffold57965_cov63-Phaeocystis_antarctica.AAC.1
MGGANDEEAVVDTRLRVRGVSPSVSQPVNGEPARIHIYTYVCIPGGEPARGGRLDHAGHARRAALGHPSSNPNPHNPKVTLTLTLALTLTLTPTLPGAQLGATVFAIAEKAADILLGTTASTPPDEA